MTATHSLTCAADGGIARAEDAGVPGATPEINQHGTAHTEDADARSVVVAGYTPLDVITDGTRVCHAAGGSAGNVSAILAFLGWKSTIVGEIGDDPTATALRFDLKRSGVSVEHLRQSGGSTARVVCRIGKHSPRYHFSCPSCGVRFPHNRRLTVGRAEDLAGSLEQPDVLFFDRANPGTIRLAAILAGRGVSIAFEPASPIQRQAKYAMAAFRLAHIVKFSTDTGMNSRKIPGIGREGQIQIVTSGRDGAHYRVGTSKWQRSPAFHYAPTIDEAGAGDWTTACFLHAMRLITPTPDDVGEALARAQAIAAVSCGFVGARGLAHAHTRDSALRIARRLKRSTTRPAHPRTDYSNEMPLQRASANGVCPTCLEPVGKGHPNVPDVRWSTSA